MPTSRSTNGTSIGEYSVYMPFPSVTYTVPMNTTTCAQLACNYSKDGSARETEPPGFP